MLTLTLQGCRVDESREFNLQPGEATETLKAYAMQAEVNILFSENEISGIRTLEVEGRMPPEAALKKMLTDTGLIFHHDKDSQAIAVYYRAP